VATADSPLVRWHLCRNFDLRKRPAYMVHQHPLSQHQFSIGTAVMPGKTPAHAAPDEPSTQNTNGGNTIEISNERVDEKRTRETEREREYDSGNCASIERIAETLACQHGQPNSTPGITFSQSRSRNAAGT